MIVVLHVIIRVSLKRGIAEIEVEIFQVNHANQQHLIFASLLIGFPHDLRDTWEYRRDSHER